MEMFCKFGDMQGVPSRIWWGNGATDGKAEKQMILWNVQGFRFFREN